MPCVGRPVVLRQVVCANTTSHERVALLHELVPGTSRRAARGRLPSLRRTTPTEVGEHAGNSGKVLLTVYAKCLDGQDDAHNERIAALLDD